MRLLVFGLTLSSAWGNGHATTFRALLKAFAARGHEVTFYERDVPWYAANRDFTTVDYCDLRFYKSRCELVEAEIARADAIIVGSYVPEGIKLGATLQAWASNVIAFYDIDTPVTLRDVAARSCDYLTSDLIQGYDLYLSFTGGPTLAELEEKFGSPSAKALYCPVDPDLYAPSPVPKRWALSYLGTYAEDRQPSLERLLIDVARRSPDARFAVGGSKYPPSIRWPPNVERIEHVPPADHAAFYSASRATLNLTRADMVARGWSPSVRLFEASACATPIISDDWEGLSSFLTNGAEIWTASCADDVLAALASPNLSETGLAARARVLGAHTAARRAARLETLLEEARPRRRRRRDELAPLQVARSKSFIGRC